jgi:hypothetical protein
VASHWPRHIVMEELCFDTTYEPKRLNASEICGENLWNKPRDPEVDKALSKAWNLRWFNKK